MAFSRTRENVTRKTYLCTTMSTATPSSDLAWCRSMLPQVSRTFALVISVLSGEKYRGVLLAYLICRIADTIEDNHEFPADKKYQLLDDFLISLKTGTPADTVETAFRPFSSVDADHDLTAQCNRVLSEFAGLPAGVRSCIIPWVDEMITGMKKFQAFSTPSATITPVQSVEELEEYCYYVAGTVGRMLTALFLHYAPRIPDQGRKVMDDFAVSFGTGLQLTNILKDFNEDLKRGWCYLPADLLLSHGLTPELVRDNPGHPGLKKVIETLRSRARLHLLNALRYTFAIPRTERQIRLFCLWPLHMANQTLAAMTLNSGLFSGGTVKISRKQVGETVLRTRLDWFSNRRQESFFHQFTYSRLT